MIRRDFFRRLLAPVAAALSLKLSGADQADQILDAVRCLPPHEWRPVSGEYVVCKYYEIDDLEATASGWRVTYV